MSDPDPKLLEFSVRTFAAGKLEIKAKNSSGFALERIVSIEFTIPKYLVNDKVNDAAEAASTNSKPVGVASLAGVVTCPAGWSVWAKPEAADATVIIQLQNDLDQAGNEISPPVTLAAGAEFVVHIPLEPRASLDAVNVLYTYQHGTSKEDKRVDGKLELKSGETGDWSPKVMLTTNEKNPTAIEPGKLAQVIWTIKDGVSAVLRGPLPNGNGELEFSEKPNSDFKISSGSIEVRVVGAMTYLLQAVVKREGHENVEVTRMLTLDTRNEKFTYLSPRPVRVLPYGLIEIDWAAWGVKQVVISVGTHTTRTIRLTQQTVGRHYEGSGFMRVNATKSIRGVITTNEPITLQAAPEHPIKGSVDVISWMPMEKAKFDTAISGLAVSAPSIGVLTDWGFYVADVGVTDPSLPQETLEFSRATSDPRSLMWTALTAVDKRFVVLKRIMTATPDCEIAPFTLDGSADEIPVLTLPPDTRPIAFGRDPVFDLVGFGSPDLVGFGSRAYIAIEGTTQVGRDRRAYSVGFDSKTKKADLRPEPQLERLVGFRLVTFDDGLYALNRATGHMLRFDLTKSNTLEPPRQAASAVKQISGSEQSMIANGLLMPVGRLLVVLSPTSVPSIASLDPYLLQNTLKHSDNAPKSDNIPQDLVYNPNKDYWARCGHDLDVKPGSCAAYRGGEAKRVWAIQPDGEIHTLAVGDESLFAPDYAGLPSKSLPPYLNTTRQFTIKNNLSTGLGAISESWRKAGIQDFSANGLAELISPVPQTYPPDFNFELMYNDANPATMTRRFLLRRPMQARTDCDYVLEVVFSGKDLSSVTSYLSRLATDGQGRLLKDEVFESHVQHPPQSVIEVSLPKQLKGSPMPFVIANSSKFNLKLDGLPMMLNYSVGSSDRIAVHFKWPDPTLRFDPRQEPNGGELGVNFNFALPPGVEVSSGSTRQTQRIRLDPDKSKLLHVAFTGLLKPGDAPLKLQGISRPIEPMRDEIVYVCQITNKS